MGFGGFTSCSPFALLTKKNEYSICIYVPIFVLGGWSCGSLYFIRTLQNNSFTDIWVCLIINYRIIHYREIKTNLIIGSLIIDNYRFIALSISRLSSFCFRSSRLSCNFLPIAQAISTFNQPLSLKNNFSGISVFPFTLRNFSILVISFLFNSNFLSLLA